MPHHHTEHHRSNRIGWLSAVLDANDGIVSTVSLIIGAAAVMRPTIA
jgi:VIT1/CCC1 family predicted Fe2+/Mn2+ transporter